MFDILHREFVYLWYYFTLQFRQIFPYLVLGIVLSSAIPVFAKDCIHEAFRLLQGKKLGFLGIVVASALGIASPICMYGTIPLAASFSRSFYDELDTSQPSAYNLQRRTQCHCAYGAHSFLLLVRDFCGAFGKSVLSRQAIF